MIFRAGLLLLTVLLGVAGLIPNQAHADLIGTTGREENLARTAIKGSVASLRLDDVERK